LPKKVEEERGDDSKIKLQKRELCVVCMLLKTENLRHTYTEYIQNI